LQKEASAIEGAVEKFISDGFRTMDIADKNTHRSKILGTGETGNKISVYIFN